jgi:hydroxyacylglutathione hydrolase
MDKRMIVRTVVVGPIATNCYIFGSRSTHDAVLIDPGAEFNKINSVVKAEGLKLNAIILTHGHYDHIGCLDNFDLPVYIHAADAEMLVDAEKNLSACFGAGENFSPDIHLLKDNDVLKVGDLELKVLHTPGHSPGGICLQSGDVLFSGDTLFCQGVGRTDLPGGSFTALSDSINKKLMSGLSDETLVLPGHGRSTTIREEKQKNEFL